MNKIGLILTLLFGILNSPQAAAESMIMPSDRVMGDENAPIEIIEYASFTCSHCANFHKNTLPKLKENYIDTGKVKFVLRPMPWDNRALAVSLITYCAPKEAYAGFSDAFFNSAETWARSDTFLDDIKKIARLGGMTGKQVESCIADSGVRKVVDKTIDTATKQHGVKATPTFFINGQKVEGAIPYAEFAATIDKILIHAK